jgi:hypothetical protein
MAATTPPTVAMRMGSLMTLLVDVVGWIDQVVAPGRQLGKRSVRSVRGS